ncbi:MAG: DUF1800 family protein [Planctomycetia bacterium]
MHIRSMSFSWRASACLALTAATAAASATSEPVVVAAPAAATAEAPRVEWNLRNAEHLLNRAAFGATSDEAHAAVARGMQATIEALFPADAKVPRPEILGRRDLPLDLERPETRLRNVEGRREGLSRLQPDLISPLNMWGDWWIERMRKSEDPLRERMTIFWHGHFVSSVKEVGDAHEMIEQLTFLRENALGDFATLLRGIGRTPAMLAYLNNDENVKEHPNENWARELFELFSLGDGNYTEDDIKQAARAFTGWTDKEGRFLFDRIVHDYGAKQVLGRAGALDGDMVVDLALEQEACARFMSAKLLHHFEGAPAPEARVAEYAAFLRANELRIDKFLRRLFADPAFYREEVVGRRVAPPIEWLVGNARRLDLSAPGQMVLNMGDVLGQRLFWPPSVKGWEPDMAWITTATMMYRSNMAGIMLGLVSVQDLIRDAEFDERSMGDEPMMAAAKKSRSNGLNQLAYIQDAGWKPGLSLVPRAKAALAVGDARLAAWLSVELLAVEVPLDSGVRDSIAAFLARERREAGIEMETALLDHPQAEAVLRRAAHFVLSLPESQLN